MLYNNEVHSHNHCCHGKAKSIAILSVSEALVIQLAKHVRSIILLSVICVDCTVFVHIIL